MNAEQYARVKDIFLEASEIPDLERAAFLDRVCGADATLRREVERLLAHHHESTIVGAAAPGAKPPAPPTASPSRPTSLRLRESTTRIVTTLNRTLGPRGSFSFAVILGGVLLIVLGIWLHRSLGQAMQELRREELQAFLRSEILAVEDWIAYEKSKVESWGRDPLLRDALGELSDPMLDEVALRTHDTQQRVREKLEAQIGPQARFLGFTTRSRCVIASKDEAELIGAMVTPLGGQLLRRVSTGTSLVRFPHDEDILLCGEPRNSPTSIVSLLVPVRAANDKVVGVLLVLEEGAAERFHSLLTRTRSGLTGEAYAFDSRAVLLSESRFNDQLRLIGLLDEAATQSSLKVQIRDPGGDMTSGFRTDTPIAGRPLTRMAALATAKRDGEDLVGYRDYRGVPVIGAWRWLPEHEIGVAAEIDHAEAYAPVRYLNMVFALATAMVVGAIGLIVHSWNSWRKLRRAIGESRQLGQYSLIERIGEGGMGTVWLAQHVLLKRPTALKLLKPEHMNERMRSWFEREVQLASRLSHPNTIEIYDFGQTPEGVYYYAMEYLPGLTLDQLISRAGALPPSRVIHILRQVCQSLAEAHAIGLVHRDIKPQNIMLCERGGEVDIVKVLDFGLAKDIGREQPNPLTAAMAGTPLYMAPERLRDPLNADPRSDLYSIGSVAFYLLTGREVFVGATDADVFYHVLNSSAVPVEELVSGLPSELAALVNGCLEKDPGQRPQEIAELLGLLKAASISNRWSQSEAQVWWQSYRAADPRKRTRPGT